MTETGPVIPPSTDSPTPTARPVLRPIPRWVIALGIPVMVLVAAIGVWLLLGFKVDSGKLDAIRTGSTLGVGLGGVVALWLAVRKQRSTELDLLQKYEAHELAKTTAEEALAHQQRVAQDARDDVIARRITDLYRQGVDQLGSDKAPVRLGGLYALERLAQDNPDPQLRQTTVNVLCAYLRMSYTERAAVPRTPRPLNMRRKARSGVVLERSGSTEDTNAFRQEREVRLTAQHILETHLKPGPDTGNPLGTYWPGIKLDLAGAHLINLDLRNGHLREVRFQDCEFFGDTRFDGAEFTGEAGFGGVRFGGTAGFGQVRFAGDAVFSGAVFSGAADFSGASFAGEADLGQAEFTGDAKFPEARFAEAARFGGTKFGGEVRFGSAEFGAFAVFGGAKFAKGARFVDARFGGDVVFGGAVFGGDAVFGGCVFRGDATFVATEFAKAARFVDAEFGGDAVFARAGFAKTAVFGRAGFADGAKFGRAAFLGDVGFIGARFGGDADYKGATFAVRPRFFDARVRVKGRRYFWPEGWALVEDSAAVNEETQETWVRLGYVPPAAGPETG